MSKAPARKPTKTRRAAPGSSANARNDLLDAALKLFAQNGFDGASLQEIANSASIGQPLVHYHFGSKDNLWRAAVEYALDDYKRFFGLLNRTIVDLRPIDALRVFMRGFLEFSAERPEHVMIILNEMRTPGERFDWLIETFVGPFHGQLDNLLSRAADDGWIVPVPVAHLTPMIMIALSHFYTFRPLIQGLYGIDPQDEDVANAHADYMIKLLFNGLQIQRPAGRGDADDET
ncbi:TetR/AcrR family transcriptional regulator [Sphingosinithalassobacter portus]|uniref:TetR/AcrR family transcriptional regulator n=1 Tax=Stakelama portus TaxID=2676234 RepID=UPI000D6E0263|nr:CerR family C-terminal domain-containing protein [Sphingosinithalassobacter portus]